MIKVLIVDDSVVFRTQITGALGRNPEIQIVGTAASGSICLQKLEQLSVDLVTLDMEMPEMSGIEVLREIRKRKIPVRVIIFSSQSQRGAEAALLALREGADDVVAKPTGDSLTIETAGAAIEAALVPKVLQFKKSSPLDASPVVQTPASKPAPTAAPSAPKRSLDTVMASAIVIGSSTGGPTALEAVFQNLKGPITIPIFIVQHMPPVFTQSLAKRLGEISNIPSKEAENGEIVQANHIYVAPGDYHMAIERDGSSLRTTLNQAPKRNSVRPAVDILFETAALAFGSRLMGIVLTGMGEDGLVGAKAIRGRGGAIMIQDKASCVVFGMPGAIYNANEYDGVGNLESVTALIRKLT